MIAVISGMIILLFVLVGIQLSISRTQQKAKRQKPSFQEVEHDFYLVLILL